MRQNHGGIVPEMARPCPYDVHSTGGPTILNNDSTIASAVLDRLLHHAQAIVIDGSSYRMKDRENQ
jgi:hypothetical protein